ncbi:hypothetical protein [Chitinimonas sp. BJB300]|uniref:hypothetical protein n=1 Tax=Chitinimonas sp. BJB300 TaxID=1559339 RepID=UPI000C11459B|nr:hypothetical protein [Chitinimonas sp. BJB300]PHV12840.1 hypothetical protein CSQ89_03810 [Chitinimonas sp. BJB300]TSJ88035.1 hypothetical protein FG002_010875 [Chitinimonas sp. BJB300]
MAELIALRTSWLLWCGVLGLGSGVLAAPVTVLVEAYPPFVVERDSTPSGPYVEAFLRLATEQGVKAQVITLPIRRAVTMAVKSTDYCVLALNFDPGIVNALTFLGRIAPMEIWVYSRPGLAGEINRLSDLKNFRVGSIDIAEIRQLLESEGILYEALQISSRGLPMLMARRFDVLISDIGPALTTGKTKFAIERHFMVTQVGRWLACHPNTDPATLTALRQVARDGLFAESTQDVWAKYGLDEYYQRVRADGAANAKP